MQEKEILLKGGNITGVVRIGQTVHRTTGPWSTAVHGLLQHLEAQGFEGAPQFLGFDQLGRENSLLHRRGSRYLPPPGVYVVR